MADQTPASTIWLFVPPGLSVEPKLIATLLASALALSACAPPDPDDRIAAHSTVGPEHITRRG